MVCIIKIPSSYFPYIIRPDNEVVDAKLFNVNTAVKTFYTVSVDFFCQSLVFITNN